MSLRSKRSLRPCAAWLLSTALLVAACSDEGGPPGGSGGGASGGAMGSGAATTASSVAAGGAAGSGVGGSTAVGGNGGGGATAPAGGPVEIDGVFNARHTGGLPAAGMRRVRDRVLIRSGHLSDITATGCSELATVGVRTVVDLRETDGSTGVTENPDAACVTTTARYLHAELPKLLPPSESVYLQILAAAEPRLGDILAALAADQALPAVLHCVIGRDRANIVMALVLLSLGVPSTDVVLDFTTNQDPSVLAEVQASWMQAVVDYVDGQGGINSYLLAHGVTSEQLTALQQAALE